MAKDEAHPDRPPLQLRTGDRVGIFGGSFNPPHVAHLAVAEAARDQVGLDRVVWIPAATPPHKQRQDLPAAEHRLAMTRRAVSDNGAFVVSDLEIERAGVSYTVETVRALQATYPEVAFHLLVGGDSFAQFSTWVEPGEIARRVPLIVYPRPGADLSTVSPSLMARATMLDRPLLDPSSTALRRLLRAGRSVRYLVPDAVLAYIAEHELYAGA
ncbi:MAG: nicotinate (nicotinamide) nucleotide adenylyltransferase [Rhodothermales bacterium]